LINFDLRAVSLQGQESNWYVHDSSPFAPGVPEFERCYPCSPPKYFNTYHFENPISVQFGQTSIRIKLYLDSGFSERAFLNQRVLALKRNFTLSGSVRLVGKLEIRDFGAIGAPLLAYDDDVDLRGMYSMLFWRPVSSGRRLETGCIGYSYNLADNR
jgi:hypothetical protein